MKNIPLDFPIQIYNFSEEKVNDTISKARLRIFYKGLNRNGSYINDTFAEKLIGTVAYAPIKGIYEDGDYTDHGNKRNEGRIYGVVPQDFNFAWEKHEDDDGVEREYACCDVYLYTALYEEAKEIVGKAHSMELYQPSIKGSWRNFNGSEVFEYTDACFLGLQVLGEGVEPCFQGSAFFTQESAEFTKLLSELLTKYNNMVKGTTMTDNITFALSARQKEDKIFNALNVEKYQYYVLDTYDTYAIIVDFEDDKRYRVDYSVAEDNSVTVDMETKKEVFMYYLTQEEYNALESLKASASSFEAIQGKIEELNSVNEKLADVESVLTERDNTIATLEQTKEEMETSLSTLQGEKEEMQTSLTALQEEKDTLSEQFSLANSELESLREFKHGIDLQEKKNVIAKYSKKLSEDVLKGYEEKIESYTLVDLDKDLAYALVNSNEGMFTSQEDIGLVPVIEPATGLTALLSKYSK